VSAHFLIESLGHRGDGMASSPSGPIYIPYTLVGETVEVERVPGHPDRAHALRIITPSPERIAPFCPHFGTCGGCAIQHWQEKPYRAWKRGLVVSALEQAGIAAPVGELLDAHGEGRRRAVLHARRGTNDILEVGFSARQAHTIIAIDRCPVLSPGMNDAIPLAWSIAEALDPLGKPLDIHVTQTLGGLDVDIRGSGALDAAHTAAIARIAAKYRVARITRHGEMVVQQAEPAIGIGRARLVLPPGSFLQATQAGEETLAKLVVQHLGKAKTVADLFCGVGPFALRIAERCRVFAVDSEETAVAALARAAQATPGLKPVETARRDLFRRPLTAPELKRFDTVVFDPPRQGAQAQARELAASAVARVIAVSCNPATFARDAAILTGGGYKLADVTPVDQFRHTPHMEIVALFVR
jgi:23S rRNA (uracil1939-C5)-methyltransferase